MILALDTETTGREPPEVIELAYAELVLPELVLRDPVTARFKPELGSCYGALAVHHILDKELEECPPTSSLSLPLAVKYIVGHNIDYDWKALGSPPVKRICTLAVARALYLDGDSHSLGAMMYRLEPQQVHATFLLKGAHAAKDDMLNCHRVLGFMLAAKGLKFGTAEELWEFSEKCRVPTIMSFGKHKGTAIKDLPYSYKTWMLKQPDMDPYVLKAVRDSL